MTNPVVEFLWSKAIQKGVVGAVTAFLGTFAVNASGGDLEITTRVLVTAVIGALTTLRNFLKVSRKISWL